MWEHNIDILPPALPLLRMEPTTPRVCPDQESTNNHQMKANWATLARARTIFILYSLIFPVLSHFMAHSRYSRNSCKKNDCLIRCHMKSKGRNKEETSIRFNAICGKKSPFNRKLLWKLTYICIYIENFIKYKYRLISRSQLSMESANRGPERG